MHKVYENDDLMMYFKKRYCHCCGKVLQRKRTERIVREDDFDHSKYCSVGTDYKPYGDILVIGKEYYCPSCDKAFSCDEQSKIIDAQKYYKRNAVTEEEINNVKSKAAIIENNSILKMRWLLLLPIVGALMCTFKIFNGPLSAKTNSKDLQKLILVSLFIFIGVALIMKFALSIANVDLTDTYKNIIIFIPSLLLFNVPTLWYINHTFKNY